MIICRKVPNLPAPDRTGSQQEKDLNSQPPVKVGNSFLHMWLPIVKEQILQLSTDTILVGYIKLSLSCRLPDAWPSMGRSSSQLWTVPGLPATCLQSGASSHLWTVPGLPATCEQSRVFQPLVNSPRSSSHLWTVLGFPPWFLALLKYSWWNNIKAQTSTKR